MKKNSILVIIFLLAGSLAAQQKYQHGLGFAGGMISGSGFSYRFLSDNFGYQINLAGISEGNNDYDFPESISDEWLEPESSATFIDYKDGRNTYLNIGFTFLKPLHSREKSTFYALAGVAIYYSSDEYSEQKYSYDFTQEQFLPEGEVQKFNKTTSTYNFGGGIGISYNLTENITIFIDWPLVLSYQDNLDIVMAIPQGGIHYFFR